MEYEKCDCGQKAVWLYMPSFKEGSPFVNAYHPPLANPEMPEGTEGVDWKWIEQHKVWAYLDEKGREHPCCEYDYEEYGFEIYD